MASLQNFPSDDVIKTFSSSLPKYNRTAVSLVAFIGDRAACLLQAMLANQAGARAAVTEYIAAGRCEAVTLPVPILGTDMAANTSDTSTEREVVYAVLAPALLQLDSDERKEAFACVMLTCSVIVYCSDGGPLKDQLPQFAVIEAVANLLSVSPTLATGTRRGSANSKSGDASGASADVNSALADCVPSLLWVFGSLAYDGGTSGGGGGGGSSGGSAAAAAPQRKGKGKDKGKGSKPKSGKQLMEAVLEHEIPSAFGDGESEDAMERREHARAVLESLIRWRDAAHLSTSSSPFDWSDGEMKSAEVTATVDKLSEKLKSLCRPLQINGRQANAVMMAAMIEVCLESCRVASKRGGGVLQQGGWVDVSACKREALDEHLTVAMMEAKALLGSLVAARVHGWEEGGTTTDDSMTTTAVTTSTSDMIDYGDENNTSSSVAALAADTISLPIEPARLEAVLAECFGQATGFFVNACIGSGSDGDDGGDGGNIATGGEVDKRGGGGFVESKTSIMGRLGQLWDDEAKVVFDRVREANEEQMQAFCHAALSRAVSDFLVSLQGKDGASAASTGDGGGGGGEDSGGGGGGRDMELWAERHNSAVASLVAAYSSETTRVGEARWAVIGSYMANDGLPLFTDKAEDYLEWQKEARQAVVEEMGRVKVEEKKMKKQESQDLLALEEQKKLLEASVAAKALTVEAARQRVAVKEAKLTTEVAELRAASQRNMSRIMQAVLAGADRSEKHDAELKALFEKMMTSQESARASCLSSVSQLHQERTQHVEAKLANLQAQREALSDQISTLRERVADAKRASEEADRVRAFRDVTPTRAVQMESPDDRRQLKRLICSLKDVILAQQTGEATTLISDVIPFTEITPWQQEVLQESSDHSVE